ncbi:MAG: copper chaperone PCu(A)C [Colwellia sp.]|nr:copper chaperone PCu(A)C [Colwellia sp.]
MNKICLMTIAMFFTLLNISNSVFAHENRNIVIDAAHIRASIPGTNVTSAYMSIENKSVKTIVLTGASSAVSDRIEIHQHVMNNGMMSMRQVKQLIIKEQEQVILQPMGYHLMIFNVKKPLLPEDNITFTLHFAHQNDVVVSIPVQSIKQEKQAKKQHHHH